MHKVYLDDQDRVVTVSIDDAEDNFSVASLQADRPALGVTQEILNAPEGLLRYQHSIIHAPREGFYHKKTSGDGTDISHYTQIADLRWAKAQAQDTIDGKTYMLLKGEGELGFLYDGHYFSMSTWGQMNLIGLAVAGVSLAFPLSWSSRNAEGIYVEYSIVDIASAQALFGVGLTRKKEIMTSGSAIKSNINDAVDQAAIDALVAGDGRVFSDWP